MNWQLEGGGRCCACCSGATLAGRRSARLCRGRAGRSRAWTALWVRDTLIVDCGADFRLTDACWLAWHALKRTSKTGLDFDAWLDTVDNVEIGEGKIVPLEGTTTPIGS